MTAAATGNTLILLQEQLSAEPKKIDALFANYKRNQHNFAGRIGWLRDADDRADSAIALWNEEIAKRDAGTTNDFQFDTDRRTYSHDDRDGLLGECMYAMKTAVERKPSAAFDPIVEIPIGRAPGFRVDVQAPRDDIQFTFTGKDSYEPDSLRYRGEEEFSLNGFINRVNNFVDRFEDWRRDAERTRLNEKAEQAKAL